MLKRKLWKIGGSCVITIPPAILEHLNLKLGDNIYVWVSNRTRNPHASNGYEFRGVSPPKESLMTKEEWEEWKYGWEAYKIAEDKRIKDNEEEIALAISRGDIDETNR